MVPKYIFIVMISAYYLKYSQATIDTTKFGSKNAYLSSFLAKERMQATANLQIINKYCKPLQVSSVLRHGTRNPSNGDITNINNVVKKFQATEANPDAVAQLAEVASMFPNTTQGQLVQAGVMELENLGTRMAQTYPSLFNKTNLDEFTFSATNVKRTIDSCNAFQKGFFNEQGLEIVAPIVNRNDILRFYDYCDKYKDLESNSSSLIQYTTFQNMAFPDIIKNYTNSLLQRTNLDITNDEMQSIYQISAIEYAALNSTNWAEYIDPQDLLLLEYSSDIESYYKLGYGYPINYEMSCPLLSTLFKDMDKVFNGESYKKGLFYFAHAETVTPLFDILGLYKDPEPLRADNFEKQTNRTFRTSHIIPFATNIEFVQYDCDVPSINNDNSIPNWIFPANPVKNMTLMLVREIPTNFPKCTSLLCDYTTVRQAYSNFIDNCNFNATCDNYSSTEVSSSSKMFTRWSILINAIVSFLFWFI